MAEIFNDPTLGRILRPVDLILIALRLTNPDITDLRLEQFGKIAGENHKQLLHLMEHGENQPSLFHKCILQTYQFLHHNGQEGDIGLPRQMIRGLRPRVWQIVTWWAHHHLDLDAKAEANAQVRKDLITYAVLDAMNYFVVNSPGGRLNPRRFTDSHTYDLIPIRSMQKSGKFDLADIWQSIRAAAGEPLHTGIPTPNRFAEMVRPAQNPEKPNYSGLSAEHILLLFAQRNVLQKWEGMDLDIDHIAPGSWFYFRSGKLGAAALWKVAGIDVWYRSLVLNSIGNKRYWPEALNRSNKDNPPVNKFIHPEVDHRTDDAHTRFGLETVGKITQASMIDDEEINGWGEISQCKDHRVWTTQRFSTFKKIVDKRRIAMYTSLYATLGLQRLPNQD